MDTVEGVGTSEDCVEYSVGSVASGVVVDDSDF